MEVVIHQAVAGYHFGHYVQAHSLPIDGGLRPLLNEVERLSDLSGYLPPSIPIPAGGYLTMYPAWSWYVIQRTWPDRENPRAGVVLSHILFAPLAAMQDRSLRALCALHRKPASVEDREPYRQPLTVSLPEEHAPLFPAPEHKAQAAALSKHWHANAPCAVTYPNDAAPPDELLLNAWSYSQPGDRPMFSACTFSLGVRRTPRGAPFTLSLGPAAATGDLVRVGVAPLSRIT